MAQRDCGCGAGKLILVIKLLIGASAVSVSLAPAIRPRRRPPAVVRRPRPMPPPVVVGRRRPAAPRRRSRSRPAAPRRRRPAVAISRVARHGPAVINSDGLDLGQAVRIVQMPKPFPIVDVGTLVALYAGAQRVEVAVAELQPSRVRDVALNTITGGVLQPRKRGRVLVAGLDVLRDLEPGLVALGLQDRVGPRDAARRRVRHGRAHRRRRRQRRRLPCRHVRHWIIVVGPRLARRHDDLPGRRRRAARAAVESHVCAGASSPPALCFALRERCAPALVRGRALFRT